MSNRVTVPVTLTEDRWYAVPKGSGLTVWLSALCELWDYARQGYDVTAVGIRYEKPVGRARALPPGSTDDGPQPRGRT